MVLGVDSRCGTSVGVTGLKDKDSHVFSKIPSLVRAISRKWTATDWLFVDSNDLSCSIGAVIKRLQSTEVIVAFIVGFASMRACIILPHSIFLSSTPSRS